MTCTALVAPTVILAVVRNPFAPEASRDVRTLSWCASLTVRRAFPAYVAAWEEAYTTVQRNGELLPPERWDDPLEAGDVVAVVPLEAGLELGTLIAQAVVGALAGAAVSLAVNLLFPPPDAEKTAEDEASSTYAFSGLRSNYEANGAAVPVLLGGRAIGGVVISSHVTTTLVTDQAGAVIDGQSELHLLFLLSEGPIHSIGGYTSDFDDVEGGALPEGLSINGNPAENYDGVRASGRLGNFDQEAIPGFEAVRTTEVVELPIEQVTESSGDPVVTDWSMAATWDMPNEADQVVISLRFAQLFELVNGNLSDESVQLQVAITKLDGNGDPVGSRVVPPSFDDGRPNPVTITGRLQAELVADLPLTLFDPATFVPAPLGEMAFCRRSTGFLQTALGPFAEFGSLNDVLGDFAVECHFRFTEGLSIDTGQERVVWSWLDVGSAAATAAGNYNMLAGSTLRGLQLKLTSGGLQLDFGGGVAGQGQTDGWQSIVVPGVFTPPTNGNSLLAQVWVVHQSAGIQRTLSVYFNGSLVFQRQSTTTGVGEVPRVRKPAARFQMGSGTGMETSSSGLAFDRVRVLNRIPNAAEVASGWNPAQVPFVDFDSASDPALVAYYSLNVADLSGSTGSGTQADPWNTGTFAEKSGQAEGLEIVDLAAGSGGVEQASGFVRDADPQKAKLRGRFRIEVQRLDAVRESTTVRDEVTFLRAVLVQDYGLTYPGWALGALIILGTEQLGGRTRPTILWDAKGVLVPVWDGNDPDNPTAPMQWTDSPAWLFGGALTSQWGLGRSFGLSNLGVESYEEAAAYQAELVDDLKAREGVSLVRHVAFTGALATTYPDGALEIQAGLTGLADTVPEHLLELGYHLVLAGTAGGTAPSWAADILAGGPYEIVEVAETTYPRDTIRVPWPDDLVSAPPTPTSWNMAATSSTIEIQGREPRLRCDLYLDRVTDKGWDVLLRIANAGRMSPIPVGERVDLRVEKPRTPVQLFSSANIEPGSFRITVRDPEEQFNVVSIEVQDRERNYERRPVRRAHSSVSDGTPDVPVIFRGFSAEGVTRVSQAQREGILLLNIAQGLRLLVEFEAGFDAAFVQVGSVVKVTHDLPLWAFSGRVHEDATTELAFKLDRTVVLDAGATYYAVLRNAANDGLQYVEISTAAGTYERGDTIALDSSLGFTPTEGDLWAIGKGSSVTKSFTVVRTRRTQENRRWIRALEYRDEVFDLKGFSVAQASSTELRVPDPDTLPSVPLTVRASDSSGPDLNTGQNRRRVEVSWAIKASDLELVTGFRVFVSTLALNNQTEGTPRLAAEVDGAARSASVHETLLNYGRSYAIRVQPIGVNGQRPSLRRIAPAHVTVQRVTSRPSVRPLAVSATLQGRSVTYEALQSGAAAEQPISIRRGGWAYGHRVFDLGAGVETSAPSEDFVALPAATDGRQNPRLFARNKLATGQFSEAASVLFEPELDAFGAALLEVNVEDEGWDTGAATLQDLEETPAGLVFEDGSTAASGNYTTRVFDLGEPLRVHVSFGIECDQLHPRTWDYFAKETKDEKGLEGGIDTWGGSVGQAWTWEGPLIPTDDPRFRNGKLRIGMRYGLGATPDVEAGAYRPGVYYLRSVQFDVFLARPGVDYDALLSRVAVALRPLKVDRVDGGTF